MKTPQLIRADHLAQGWPQTEITEDHEEIWVLARPLSVGNLFTRLQLAWMVFTGKCDALKWYRQ